MLVPFCRNLRGKEARLRGIVKIKIKRRAIDNL